jgi:hypothetical protein
MLWLLIALNVYAAPPTLGGVSLGAPPPADFSCYAVNESSDGARACVAKKVELGRELRADVGLELCGKAVHKAVFSIIYTNTDGGDGLAVVADPKVSADAAAGSLAQMLGDQGYALTPSESTTYRSATKAPWTVSVLTMQLSTPPKIPIGSWQASAILQRDGACKE